MSSYFEQLQTATQQLSVTIYKCALKSSMNKTKKIYEPNLIKSKEIHKLGKAAKNVGQNLNYNKQSLTNSEGYLVRILTVNIIPVPYPQRPSSKIQRFFRGQVLVERGQVLERGNKTWDLYAQTSQLLLDRAKPMSVVALSRVMCYITKIRNKHTISVEFIMLLAAIEIYNAIANSGQR